MEVTNVFAQRVVAESYTLAGKYSPLLPTFLKYLPSHNLPELHGTMQCLLHDTRFEAFRAVLVRTPVF
jgi:hypothetical protein